MDFSIASILALDGLTNGAIYALLALATVLVFAVTRVIFIPQGEFVAFGALTLALLQTGKVPGTVWFLLVLAGAVAVTDDLVDGLRHRHGAARIATAGAAHAGLPGGRSRCSPSGPRRKGLPLLAQAALTLALVTPFGTLIYRLAYESLADASVLVLLIVSVGVHFALRRPGPVLLRRRGLSQPELLGRSASALGPLTLTGQTLIIFVASLALIVAAVAVLRALAVRQGAARHRGQPPRRAADGHLDGRRRAAVVHDGGLHRRAVGPADRADDHRVLRQRLPDRPEGLRRRGLRRACRATRWRCVGALGVGLLESFGSFWASAFKEVIVFGSILPVLLWRSLRDPHGEEH